MKLYITKKTIIAVFLSVLLFSACTGKQDKETAAEKETQEEETQDLLLSRQQMQSVGITVGPLEQKDLSTVVKANGQLAVPPQNKADVSVLSGGIIRTITVLEGQQVKKGQVLATIENQELIRIQQDYLTAKNSFSYIQAEYNRQTQLREAGAGTGKSFQSAEATYNSEKSRITAYESQLLQLGISPSKISGGHTVSRFPLLAPISGTVGQIAANTGAFVQPGTAIMEVVDNSKIHCDLIVFEKDLMKVKLGQTVNFQLTNQENQQIKGKINGINKSFENESKGVIVHAVIENSAKQNLIPGMYVTALISVGNQLSPAVPIDAVVRSEGKEYVFIAEAKGDKFHFLKAEVKTGVSELGYIQINALRKLPANVQLVTGGAFYLESKSAGGAEE